jgi:hypothetical protein
MSLDRNYLPQHLAEAASKGTAYVNGQGLNGHNVVYELKGTRSGPAGEQVLARSAADPNGTWWNMKDLAPREDGKIHLPDRTILSHVAVPKSQELKAADHGASLDLDQNMQNQIRAATGKGIRRHKVENGDGALRAIHDSVKDIGIAGAVVQWKNDPVTHQLIVKGARDLGGGQYSFDVFEPWTGKTRTVSGEQLKSQYTTGVGKSEGELKYVQLPDDMTLGKTSLLDKREALARNQIEIHQPQKLPELAKIEKVTGAVSRSVQAQMLLHSDSVDGMKSILTSHFPALQNADAHALGSLINIYKANPTVEARSALIRLMPVLGKLPEGVRNYALEQLNSMVPQDLQRTAQRLADSRAGLKNSYDDAAGMQFARQIFGRDVPATNARTGATADIAASDAAKPKAPSGGDAADTIRMQKARGGEGSGPSGPTQPKPDPGVPTYGNLPDRVPTGGQRVEIIEKDGKYFERDYETDALTQASGQYAFARMPDGSLWASQYGHAEASMGGRVAYAGQAKFENGVLKEWSGESGTYKPVGGDFASQAGFKTPPQPIPPHSGKKVQLPVFQEPRGSVIIPTKVDKSLHTPGASEHDASPERPAGAGGRSTPPPVPGVAAGAPAAPPGDAAPLPKGSAVWFMPPGGDRARLVVVYEGKAGYMSTGSVTSHDVAGNAITKETGKYYEIRGVQERTRFTLAMTPAKPIDAEGFDDKMLIFDKGWLIKGQGFTSSEVLPPKMPWNNVEFEVQGTITNPQKLNEWIRSQGGQAIGDAEPMLPDHFRVVPSKTETR